MIIEVTYIDDAGEQQWACFKGCLEWGIDSGDLFVHYENGSQEAWYIKQKNVMRLRIIREND